MIAWRTVVILGWTVLLLALGTQPILAMTPYDDVLVQQAVKDVQQENYDEAWAKGAHTPEKAFRAKIFFMLSCCWRDGCLRKRMVLKFDTRSCDL